MTDWTPLTRHIEELITRNGVTIHELPMTNDAHGYYDHEHKIIYISDRLPARWRVATLAHEYHHHLRGHTGPQPQHVEDSVDEAAAKMIIDPDAYARAETAVGSHPGALAVELDTPKWIVEAWQRILARSIRTH